VSIVTQLSLDYRSVIHYDKGMTNTITKLTTRPSRGQSWSDWRDAWAEAFVGSDPFRASAITGQTVDVVWSQNTGRLSESETGRMRADWTQSGALYVIYSYLTPIAWKRGDGTWYVSDASYSPTTTGPIGMATSWFVRIATSHTTTERTNMMGNGSQGSPTPHRTVSH